MNKLKFLGLIFLLTLSSNSFSHGGGHGAKKQKKPVVQAKELVSFVEASDFVINKYLNAYEDDEIEKLTFKEVHNPASAFFDITMNYTRVSDNYSCHVMVTLYKKNNVIKVDESGSNLLHSQCHAPVKHEDHSGHKH